MSSQDADTRVIVDEVGTSLGTQHPQAAVAIANEIGTSVTPCSKALPGCTDIINALKEFGDGEKTYATGSLKAGLESYQNIAMATAEDYNSTDQINQTTLSRQLEMDANDTAAYDRDGNSWRHYNSPLWNN